jgi:hypothetical protein
MTHERLAFDIQRLHSTWEAGDRSDPALRQECAADLKALRNVFRERPTAFTPDMVATLRAIARALREPVAPVQLPQSWTP